MESGRTENDHGRNGGGQVEIVTPVNHSAGLRHNTKREKLSGGAMQVVARDRDRRKGKQASNEGQEAPGPTGWKPETNGYQRAEAARSQVKSKRTSSQGRARILP